MKITYATISKAGRRQDNEDAYRIIDTPERNRWMGIVCDGMGGHAKGDIASSTVVKAISDYWTKFAAMYDREEKVVKACKRASIAIDGRSSRFNHCQMGTTMVMASIEGNKVTIAHVGDSRCYLVRPGHYDYDDIANTDRDHIVYQTQDHVRLDFGWEVVAKCFFSYRPEVAVPETAQFELQSGDRLFLCSDGVHKSIAPHTLKEHLLSDDTPDAIIDAIDTLCQRNADDNYTAILVRID